MTKPKLEIIPFAKLVESPWNPRKRFDPLAQATLTASMEAHGQLVPGVVRPQGAKFELAAGHRRSRSAKAAKLEGFLAIVRELSDAEFCEILAIENDEREDVHPLEQANGFKLLMEKSGYDVAKIATRIQRGHDFVYDRLRLLQLNPDLKELFLDGRFGLSQAIVLAKLSPDEQSKASVKPKRYDGNDSGLWHSSGPTLDEKTFPLVANTAAELEYWISRHLRFDETKVQLEEQFPETAELLHIAEETGVRVVAITFGEHLPPSIERTDEKILTKNFWKRADGLEGSKVCEYAVVGVVKAQDGRGQAFGICTSRDACTVHWASRIAERKRREKSAKPSSSSASAGSAAKQAQAEARAEAAQKKRAAAAKIEQERVAKVIPLLLAAIDQVKEKPTKEQVLGARKLIATHHHLRDTVDLSDAQMLVAIALQGISRTRGDLAWKFENDWQRKELIANCAAVGISVPALLKSVKVDKPSKEEESAAEPAEAAAESIIVDENDFGDDE